MRLRVALLIGCALGAGPATAGLFGGGGDRPPTGDFAHIGRDWCRLYHTKWEFLMYAPAGPGLIIAPPPIGLIAKKDFDHAVALVCPQYTGRSYPDSPDSAPVPTNTSPDGAQKTPVQGVSGTPTAAPVVTGTATSAPAHPALSSVGGGSDSRTTSHIAAHSSHGNAPSTWPFTHPVTEGTWPTLARPTDWPTLTKGKPWPSLSHGGEWPALQQNDR